MEKESHYRKTVRHQKKLKIAIHVRTVCLVKDYVDSRDELSTLAQRHIRIHFNVESVDSVPLHLISSYRIALNCIVSYRIGCKLWCACVLSFDLIEKCLGNKITRQTNRLEELSIHIFFDLPQTQSTRSVVMVL